MPDDALGQALELFSAPIETVILAVGKGISEAQRQLDQNSAATQAAYDTDPILSQYGLQATWYQFPRCDLELRVSLTVVEDQSVDSTPPAPAPARGAASSAAPPPAPPPMLAMMPVQRLLLQPISASFQNHFNYDAKASSTITLSIVPVPAPNTSFPPPQLTQTQAQAAALGVGAKFKLVTGAGGQVPDPGLRFDIRYAGGTGTWFVKQFDPANPGATMVLVAVDDKTAKARIVSQP